MSGFLEKYNTDDVFMRSLILGLIRMLNDKISYKQVNDKQEVLEVYVPFIYSITGDESFIKDNFIDIVICDEDTEKKFADGNYDVIPRGVVTLSNVSINPSALTNKFIRNNYIREDVKGNVKTFSSYVNNIPLDIDFQVKVRVDTLLDVFKIFQAMLSTFTKVDQFMFDFEGIQKIPAQVGFPSQYDNDKILEFSYLTVQQYIEISCNIKVETYFPQKDLSTERFRGNLMQAGIEAKMNVDKEIDDRQSLIN